VLREGLRFQFQFDHCLQRPEKQMHGQRDKLRLKMRTAAESFVILSPLCDVACIATVAVCEAQTLKCAIVICGKITQESKQKEKIRQ